MSTLHVYDSAHKLADELRQDEAVKNYKRLHDIVYADATNKALLDEYMRLQVRLQMSMVSGAGQLPTEDMQRFQKIASLLFINNDVQEFLLAQMKVQRMTADLIKIISDATGFEISLPDGKE